MATNALELGVLGEPQTNLSMQGIDSAVDGTAVPIYDPAVVGQLNWTHTTTPQTNASVRAPTRWSTNTALPMPASSRAFASGAQAGLEFQQQPPVAEFAGQPLTIPTPVRSLGLNVTQPLLRGFGASLNRRFIRIAGNEQKITSLLFRQQLIATVYGVIRLYTDFVALYEDEKVKQETRQPGREAARRYARRRWTKARWRRWK